MHGHLTPSMIRSAGSTSWGSMVQGGCSWMRHQVTAWYTPLHGISSWTLHRDETNAWGGNFAKGKDGKTAISNIHQKKKKMNAINVNLRRNFKSDSEVLTPLSCPTFESQLCIFLNSNGLTLGLKISDTCRDKSDSEMGLISELVFDAMVQCGNYISCL